jgi:hypothetical protein
MKSRSQQQTERCEGQCGHWERASGGNQRDESAGRQCWSPSWQVDLASSHQNLLLKEQHVPPTTKYESHRHRHAESCGCKPTRYQSLYIN